MLAPAAFCAALVIGLVAIVADHRFNVPPIGMTVAPIVIMMPGVYAFEAIVLFNRGQMAEALQASASCWFVIGALAMGLAAARFFSPNELARHVRFGSKADARQCLLRANSGHRASFDHARCDTGVRWDI
jgi:uncharacterized membrane protein YjjB (DUF3815 family)